MSGHIILTAKDNNSELTMPKGSSFTIVLDENPTTGYKWSFKNLDENLFELLSDDFQLHPASEVGGGGIRSFKLKIKGLGKHELQLVYSRRWESSATESFELVVISK